MKIRPIKAWAVIKNGKISPLEIYADGEVETFAGERKIRVIIKPDETKNTKSIQKNS